MKARLPKGMGSGGANNMNAMIRQAQKMQEEMAKKQEEIAQQEFSTSVGGGVVEVTMTGNKILKKISIKPDIVDPEDVEMLEDLVMGAVNEVYRMVEEQTEAEMESITGGINLPGIV